MDATDITRMLVAAREGEPGAMDDLFESVYPRLLEIAKRRRRGWRGNETVDTTALVHEAYLRLADQSEPEWQNRAHFLAVASTAMRHILLDYAKRKRAAKRGGEYGHVALHEMEAALKRLGEAGEASSEALIALDESLRRLEKHDRRQSRIVICRFFGDMTIRDTAEALGVSPATVKRGWAMAQAWLYRDLKQTLEGSS